ncbi:MAG: NFACT family protein [Candidatus Woesearchaeota archaeon]
MKSDISSLELHYMLKELQLLIGAKIEQIYELGKEELVIQFHVPNTGKQILRIVLGKMLYIASVKGGMPEKPPGFCLHLRKRLKSARVREVSQIGFDRIVEFFLETKDAKFRFTIELFSKGNIILCDESGKIISVLERQEWKGRSIRPGQQYAHPKKEVDFLTLTKEGLDSVLAKSDRESLVKSLAIDLGLGGIYAEEVCLISGVDKNLKPGQLSDKEKQSLLKASVSLVNMDIESFVIYKDAEKTEVKDVVPLKIQYYRSLPAEPKESFSAALDSVFTTHEEHKELEHTENAAKTKIDKINEMISQQTLRVKGLEESADVNQRKGEVIYENYPIVEQVLKEIAELKKELSWADINKRFKGHKIIKGVDEKTGEITLEL